MTASGHESIYIDWNKSYRVFIRKKDLYVSKNFFSEYDAIKYRNEVLRDYYYKKYKQYGGK